MKLYKTKKDPELFYYYNSKNEKMWCFRHRYYDALGKRREKTKRGYKKEKEAYRALLEIKANTLNGDTKQVENSNITVSEWVDIWFETHKTDWKASTIIQRENAIKNHIKPHLGNYKLAELDKTTYKRVFINKLLDKGLSPNTVQLQHQLFKIAVNVAVDDELIPRNRFNTVRITKEHDDTLKNFLTAEELNKFLSVAKQKESYTNYTALFLLAFTGLRKGEAFGLKWEDINFNDSTLTVNRTRDVRGVRPPKTQNSYRTIMIDDIVISHLKAYKKWCKEQKLSRGMRLSDNDYVLISSLNVAPVCPTILNHCVNRVCDAAPYIKQITPHGLRHTHATILIGQRIPVNVIADRLGNTPQMIYNVYGHTFKELEQESVIAFSESLNAAGASFGATF